MTSKCITCQRKKSCLIYLPTRLYPALNFKVLYYKQINKRMVTQRIRFFRFSNRNRDMQKRSFYIHDLFMNLPGSQ